MAKDKTGGRKKGTSNKKTTENKDRVNRILAHIDEHFLIEDIDNLSSSERVKTYVSLMEYVMPKLARIAHEGKEDATIQVQMDLSNLTNDELTSLKGIVANATSDRSGGSEA